MMIGNHKKKTIFHYPAPRLRHTAHNTGTGAEAEAEAGSCGGNGEKMGPYQIFRPVVL